MNINEMIEKLTELRNRHGGDVRVIIGDAPCTQELQVVGAKYEVRHGTKNSEIFVALETKPL